MSVKGSEVWPNAPLALVAAQVRYPAVAEYGLGIAQRVRDEFGDWEVRSDTSQTFEATIGGLDTQTSVRSETFYRIISKGRTRIITVQPSNFTLEVSDYVGFADFRDLLERTSSAVERVLRPEGILRVGLRYIDEINVSEPRPDWGRWLDPSLMAPALPPELTPSQWTGAVQYRVTPNQVLVFRYGTSEDPVVSPTGPLARPRVPKGPIFVLDFDSSWRSSDTPQFTADRIVEVADRLHRPLRSLFDRLITPQLLAIFRQEPQND